MTAPPFDTHTNPAVLASVRHTITPEETMRKYYGEVARNADAAFVLCGNDSLKCSGKIEGCEFRSKMGVCNLQTVMAVVGDGE